MLMFIEETCMQRSHTQVQRLLANEASLSKEQQFVIQIKSNLGMHMPISW